jgi:hypothetical protein
VHAIVAADFAASRWQSARLRVDRHARPVMLSPEGWLRLALGAQVAGRCCTAKQARFV